MIVHYKLKIWEMKRQWPVSFVIVLFTWIYLFIIYLTRLLVKQTL